VQVVAGLTQLMLELPALQPADAVLAADRAAEPQREAEQLVARVVGALFLVEVVGREEERRVDVAVTRMTERQCDHVVALANLDRLARDVAQLVERHGDVLAVGAAALREDRERCAAAPTPQLGDFALLERGVDGDRVFGERLLQLGRDTARLRLRAVGLGDDHEPGAVGQAEGIRVAGELQRDCVEVLDRGGYDA